MKDDDSRGGRQTGRIELRPLVWFTGMAENVEAVEGRYGTYPRVDFHFWDGEVDGERLQDVRGVVSLTATSAIRAFERLRPPAAAGDVFTVECVGTQVSAAGREYLEVRVRREQTDRGYPGRVDRVRREMKRRRTAERRRQTDEGRMYAELERAERRRQGEADREGRREPRRDPATLTQLGLDDPWPEGFF